MSSVTYCSAAAAGDAGVDTPAAACKSVCQFYTQWQWREKAGRTRFIETHHGLPARFKHVGITDEGSIETIMSIALRGAPKKTVDSQHRHELSAYLRLDTISRKELRPVVLVPVEPPRQCRSSPEKLGDGRGGHFLDRPRDPGLVFVSGTLAYG